jgi:hypothetical protein
MEPRLGVCSTDCTTELYPQPQVLISYEVREGCIVALTRT